MKIIVIRHAAVNMQWEKKYTSYGFDRACRLYETSHIKVDESVRQYTDDRPVYVSTAIRTQETARLLFGDKEFVITPLLDETPLRSWKDTDRYYSLNFWNAVGRLQWLFNIKRQPETNRETRQRTKKLIHMLVIKDEDCILISHGWFLNTLIGEFKSAGFVVKRSSVTGIAPLERIVLTEKSLHCGNCRHNCLLENPGCAIGKEKALIKRISAE